jgi:sugar/nucleoside kinase (ribokinase family)
MLTDTTIFSDSLCVIGNINRDLKTAPLRVGDHLFKDGETSVNAISETIGGGGANSACAAASLGARVAFLGKVGADALGDRLEQTLVQHGVNARLARDRQHPTGTSINLNFDNGHRHFVSCLPNNESLSFGDLDLNALSGCRHLFRADIWFSEEMLFGGNERLLQHARKLGLATSIDLNWDPRWSVASVEEIRTRKQAVRAVLPLAMLAHGNVRELTEFADASDLETALHRLTEWGARAVVVHLGTKGAGYFHNGQLIVEPPVLARAQINTAGTGDILSVCLMLLHEQTAMPIQEKLHLANTIVSEFIEGQRSLIPAVSG